MITSVFESEVIRRVDITINVLMDCHGNISKSPEKACKISGSLEQKGAYYTTTTPFLKEP